MSYYLADRNGYVSELASISGLAEMKMFVGKFLSSTTPLMEFLDDGQTTEMQLVSRDIQFVLGFVSDQSIRHTLQELQHNLGKAKEIAIVAQ